MQPHPYTYDDLIDFLLGRSEPGKSVLIGRHLAECTYCAGTVARYSKIRALLHQDFSINPPARAVARAKAIATKHPVRLPLPQLLFNLRSRKIAFTGGFAFALVIFLVLSIFAEQDTTLSSMLYPVVISVQGLQVGSSTVGQFFGIKPPSTTKFTPAVIKSTSSETSSSNIVISQIYGGG